MDTLVLLYYISSGIKRRVTDSRTKLPDSATSSSANISLVSTTTANPSDPPVITSTNLRRPVRERLGPRPTEDKRLVGTTDYSDTSSYAAGSYILHYYNTRVAACMSYITDVHVVFVHAYMQCAHMVQFC